MFLVLHFVGTISLDACGVFISFEYLKCISFIFTEVMSKFVCIVCSM